MSSFRIFSTGMMKASNGSIGSAAANSTATALMVLGGTMRMERITL